MTVPPPSGPLRPRIGVSDFRALREPGVHYIDKTDFVAGVLAATSEVLPFARP